MRYIILIILNLPIVFAALVNIVTQYKLRKVTKARFHHQIFTWVIILVVIIASFPVYNTLSGRPLLDSSELSVFDILQTTAIIFLFYVINNQRQRIDQDEKRLQNLHQELSITLSKKGD